MAYEPRFGRQTCSSDKEGPAEVVAKTGIEAGSGVWNRSGT